MSFMRVPAPSGREQSRRTQGTLPYRNHARPFSARELAQRQRQQHAEREYPRHNRRRRADQGPHTSPGGGRARRRRPRRARIGGALILGAVLSVVLMTQVNGAGGAGGADLLRAVIGPAATAGLEARYLGFSDALRGVRYRLAGQRISPPWRVSATPVSVAVAGAPRSSAPPITGPTTGRRRARVAARPRPLAPTAAPNAHPRDTRTRSGAERGGAGRRGREVSPRQAPAASRSPTVFVTRTLPAPARARRALRKRAMAPLQPHALPVVLTPALPGEGIWTTAGLPAPGPTTLVPVVKTFIRPDPTRPYALATILQFDLRVTRIHMVAGTAQPGGPRGMPGGGAIPGTEWQGTRLLAAVNGGFKYADGAYGMMAGGTVYVPPVWAAATIALTRSGRAIMGSWGLDRRLTGANSALTAWRQNGALLVDHGRIASVTQDGAAWGLTILNNVYTWRSGIGLTRHGTFLYVAGNALSAVTLAQALRDAGATTAMQLDINPFWVRAFTYTRDTTGQLIATRLDPAMQGSGGEYLSGNARDFFYVTRSTLPAR